MDWSLSLVDLDSDMFAFYSRGDKSVFERIGSSEDLPENLETGLGILSKKSGVESVTQLLKGQGMVRLASSTLSDLVKQGAGQKIGVILNEGCVDDLTEQEKKYLPLTGDNVVPVSDAALEGLDDKTGGHTDEVITAYKNLLKVGVHSVVICLGGSSGSADHEKKIKNLLMETYPSRFLGGVPVYVSSDFETGQDKKGMKNLTLLSAFVQSRMRKYLFEIEQRFKELGYHGGLFLGNRYGGLSRWDKTRAIDTSDSVFSAVMVGADSLARDSGIENAVVFHVGEDRTDIGVIREGRIVARVSSDLLGIPISAPSSTLMGIPAGNKTGANESDAVSANQTFVAMLSDRIKTYFMDAGWDLSGFDLVPAGINAASYCEEAARVLKVKACRIFDGHEALHAAGLSSMDLAGPEEMTSAVSEAE